MSVLVDQDTRLLVHGIATRKGLACAERMIANGTAVLAGVADGHGGEWIAGVPVFDSVREAVHATDANAAVLAVSPGQVQEAILEQADAGLLLSVCITPAVPAWDMIRVHSYLTAMCRRDRPLHLIGPDSAGVFTPGKCLAGMVAVEILRPGTVGVLSRSGSLTYEATWLLTQAGFGQSTVVCVGSGLILGAGFVDVLAMFEDDPVTEQVVMIGEIGSREEEMAARFIRDQMTKPVIAFVAGQTSPPGRKMGHSGAMIEGYDDTALLKMKELEQHGVQVAHTLDEIPNLLAN